jgi:hypothetical protein
MDKTWAEFLTLEAAICMLRVFDVISKTGELTAENSAKTTSVTKKKKCCEVNSRCRIHNTPISS